jgi:hypothetical protein
MKRLILAPLILLLLTTGCTSSSGGDPSEAVERYLTAKIEGDSDGMRPYLCSALEATLSREALSFSGVEAEIEGLDCQRDGDTDVVTCAGEIVAIYGTETSRIPLTSYRITQEDGEWKWCGEAE